MHFESRFSFGDILYLKTDKDQLSRQLIRIQFSKGSSIYELSCGNSSSWYYEFEITVEKSVLAMTGL